MSEGLSKITSSGPIVGALREHVMNLVKVSEEGARS